jgi:hypothetical protein
MKTELVKLSEVKNNPNNPRTLKDDKFHKLVKSIKEFPEMLEIRPIVVNDDMIVLGGNMRLKACKEAGLKEVHIIKASNLTEEQQKQFIIKDNVGFGEWDWDMLANEWNAEELESWGLDVPNWSLGVDENDMTDDDVDVLDEFDPVGTSSGYQRVVFIFQDKDEAENYFAQFPDLPLKKMNMAWQIDLTNKNEE